MLAVSLFIILVVAVVFLIYILIGALFKKNSGVSSHEAPIPFKASFDDPPKQHIPVQNSTHIEPENVYQESSTNISEIIEPKLEEPREPTLKAPDVPGQSAEELTSPEPLQERVSTKADVQSAMDPYEKNDSVALFGSNLRHPEASFSKTEADYGSLENEIVAGLASSVSKPTAIDKVQFSAEMAQNGGEFMNGIFAFDSSDSGGYFSSL